MASVVWNTKDIAANISGNETYADELSSLDEMSDDVMSNAKVTFDQALPRIANLNKSHRCLYRFWSR